MKPKQLFFVMLGLLVLIIGGSGAIYTVVRSQLHKDIQTINDKRLELELINVEARALGETADEYEAVVARGVETYADQLIPESKDQAVAIQRLFNALTSIGLEVSEIGFAPTKELPEETSQSLASPVSGVYSLPVKFSLASGISYPKLKELIKTIENQPRHMSIFKLDIAPSLNDQEETILNVSMEVYIHYRGKPQAPPISQAELEKKLKEAEKKP